MNRQSSNQQYNCLPYKDRLKHHISLSKQLFFNQVYTDEGLEDALFYVYLPNYDYPYVNTLENRIRDQKGGIIQQPPWTDNLELMKTDYSHIFVIVSDILVESNDAMFLKYDNSRQDNDHDSSTREISLLKSNNSNNRRQNLLQCRNQLEFSQQHTPALKLNATFQMILSSKVCVLTAKMISKYLIRLEAFQPKWHTNKYSMLRRILEIPTTRVFGYSVIKEKTYANSFMTRQLRDQDELQNYQIMEGFSNNGQQSINIYFLDISMPFGVSYFPNHEEKDKIVKNMEDVLLRAEKEMKELFHEQKAKKDVQIVIPQPKTGHNICFICQKAYQNYFGHIESKNHKMFLETQNQYWRYIDEINEELNFKFKVDVTETEASIPMQIEEVKEPIVEQISEERFLQEEQQLFNTPQHSLEHIVTNFNPQSTRSRTEIESPQTQNQQQDNIQNAFSIEVQEPPSNVSMKDEEVKVEDQQQEPIVQQKPQLKRKRKLTKPRPQKQSTKKRIIKQVNKYNQKQKKIQNTEVINAELRRSPRLINKRTTYK